jgi:hypothetical protein
MTSPKRATPNAPVRSSVPSRPRLRASEQVVAALALLIVGAFAGVLVMNLFQGSSPGTATATSTAPSESTDVGETDAIQTDTPEESLAAGSSVLEARLPATLDGVPLTVESAVDATSLSSGPDGRALNAAVVHLGKLPSDLEIAIGFDESGSLDLTILGFRVDGISAPEIRAAVLSAWLSAGTPGVATTSLEWSGIDVTKVSYGDDGLDEYVITVSDGVFVLETADAALAQSAAAALVNPANVPAASAEASPAS